MTYILQHFSTFIDGFPCRRLMTKILVGSVVIFPDTFYETFRETFMKFFSNLYNV